jgi:uncharacterized protein (TIGR02271 family)
VTTHDAGQIGGWIGETAHDVDGHKIGRVEAIYEDDDGSGPEWFAISTGWFGSRVSFVPVRGATFGDGKLFVRWTKDIVRDAPHFDADEHLTPQDEAQLYSYYGMEWSPAAQQETAAPQEHVSTDDAMTRSEEELVINTFTQETGRVRLKKWIETENVTVTVPVRREMARVIVERADGQTVDVEMPAGVEGDEHDVVLWKEEIVVDKKIVPKERIRLEKEVVEEQRVVSDEVRKEKIALHSDIPDRTTP